MSDKHWVDKDHYRVVAPDGASSRLYEVVNCVVLPDRCVEIADHNPDGTTTAYEYNHGTISNGKGDPK